MQVLYLGTGGSEGIPSPFCACPVCREARTEGGRNIRRRSSIVIDGALLIDVAPDFWAQSLAYSLDPNALETILVTHHHPEHIYLTELYGAPLQHPDGTERKLSLYIGETVLARYQKHLSPEQTAEMEARLTIHTLRPFEPAVIGDYTVTPLPARHSKGALIYLVEKDGRTFLYGNDSGFFPEKTWDHLAGRKLHAVSLDCDNPFCSDTPDHMCVEDAVTTRRRLFQLGCIDASVRVYISHISHHGGVGHNELQERMTLYGITAAYDGLKIDI